MAQTIRNKLESARKQLQKHNQVHLMRFVDQLSRDQQVELLAEIGSIDFALIEELIAKYVLSSPEIKLAAEILPAPLYPIIPEPGQTQKYEQALERGECLIAEGRVAAFTVAGGMGTRLNFDGPKGMLPTTPVRNKILFRVFAESIVAVQRRFNCEVPWYIMTSLANHKATLQCFQENNYFGLSSANVILFTQGMVPCFDHDGKILLSSKHRLAMSPDGHGGSLRALYNSGALNDMARRGIEYISYFQVDNPLVSVIDPLFIGLHALDGAEMSSKAVIKCDPLERVGNFGLVDGKITVIEYSDLPDKLAKQRRQDGHLLFELGSIAIHIISRNFIERLNQHGFSLPWHRAVKGVEHMDENGNLIKPSEPNAVKLETFVFDALPLADKSIILQIDRAEQFGPIKNSQGPDSLDSSQKMQIARAARWMEQAGLEVPHKPDGSIDILLEISPLFALDAAELKQKRRQLRPLKPGDIVYLG